MIKFGDIRQILDKWTCDCVGCELKEREYREEDVDEDIYPYETCSPDCSTYYAKKIKDGIISLLDVEEVSTKPIHSIPCHLHFKGMLDALPLEGVDGELWYLSNIDPAIKSGNYYWYDGRWNYLAVGDLL